MDHRSWAKKRPEKDRPAGREDGDLADHDEDELRGPNTVIMEDEAFLLPPLTPRPPTVQAPEPEHPTLPGEEDPEPPLLPSLPLEPRAPTLTEAEKERHLELLQLSERAAIATEEAARSARWAARWAMWAMVLAGVALIVSLCSGR